MQKKDRFERGELAEFWGFKMKEALSNMGITLNNVAEITGLPEYTMNQISKEFPIEFKFALFLYRSYIECKKNLYELEIENLKGRIYKLQQRHGDVLYDRRKGDDRPFGTRTPEFLLSLLNGEIDGKKLALDELQRRGLDENGNYVLGQRNDEDITWRVELQEIIEKKKWV